MNTDDLIQMAIEELYATGGIPEDLYRVLTDNGLRSEVLDYCEGFLRNQSKLYEDAVTSLRMPQ